MNSIIDAQIELEEQQQLEKERELLDLEFQFWFGIYLKDYNPDKYELKEFKEY